MAGKVLKTREEVRADFERKGLSVRRWALKHGVAPGTVAGVLSGRLSGRFGESHKIVVLLGIKDGVIVEDDDHEHA